MYCPNCSQERVSTETSFCSRCGMPLGGIAEVLANGGVLPQIEPIAKKKPLFSKKNGVVFGTFWFIFLTMFCTAFFGILNAPEELIGIIAITGVFGALMIIIGSLVFLPGSKPLRGLDAPPIPGQIPGNRQNSLPPPLTLPVSAYSAPRAGNWRDTSDLEPTSVTESTTRLLDDKDVPNSR